MVVLVAGAALKKNTESNCHVITELQGCILANHDFFCQNFRHENRIVSDKSIICLVVQEAAWLRFNENI